MDKIAAQFFFDRQVQPRWPDWQPEGVEISDWVFWIGKTDEDTALSAIREHASGSRWKRPTLGKFRTLVRLKAPPKEKVEQPEPTVFVMYEGGGLGTTLAGYFFPIITLPGVDVMKAAEHMRAKHEGGFGGTWKVYAEATHYEMTKMRSEFQKKRVNDRSNNDNLQR